MTPGKSSYLITKHFTSNFPLHFCRFVSSDYHLFSPDHSLADSAPLEFTLPPLRFCIEIKKFKMPTIFSLEISCHRSKAVYRINQMVMSCSVSLLQSDGSKIPNSKEIGNFLALA